MSKLSKVDVIGLFQEHGTILNGHFELPSGLHSQTYIQTALVLQYPNLAQQVAKSICDHFPSEINLVVTPGGGALVIGQEVARIKRCRSIFAERVSGKMAFKREFAVRPGDKILIVEDVMTTGKSTSQVQRLCAQGGGKVIGVGAIVDRSTETLPLQVPVRALISYPLHVFEKDHCPLCVQSTPITPIGSSSHAK